MTLPRRDVMKALTALGVAAGVPSPFMEGMAAHASEMVDRQAMPIDEATFQFWTNFTSTERPRGAPAPDAALEPTFVYWDRDHFLPPSEIDPVVEAGTVTVRYGVAGMKFSNDDLKTMSDYQNLQFRLDMLQTFPILSVLETLAWTAVGALNAGTTIQKAPLSSLTFDPATSASKMQNMVLPQGEGRWAVNVYAQKQESIFSRILQGIVKDSGKFFLALGLPAISIVALDSFNRLYGLMHDRPRYLFHMNPIPVLATQQAKKAFPASRALSLRSGSYVLVRNAQASILDQKTLADCKLTRGYVVKKDTPDHLVYDVAKTLFPEATYATLDVSVREMQLQ